MKLYFSPLSCSLATRIAFYEAGATDITFDEIDPETKQTSTGRDFRSIHPLGLVPALEIEPGDILAENAAVLQYVGRRYPEARLVPSDATGLSRLQQWLCFIGTEIHKAIYLPLLDSKAPEQARTYALTKVDSRFSWLSEKLAGHEYLLDHFTVADAYLVTVLNWSSVTPVDLAPWPVIRAYHARLRERPSVARAFSEELELYRKEVARHAASQGAPMSSATAR